MYRFKTGQVDILVATDIVARGIDIDDIQLVINYDVPHDEEDYVHRIGRTARAGRDGRAITLVSEKDQPLFAAIERFLEKEVPKEPVPEEFGEAPAYTGRGERSRTSRSSRSGRSRSSRSGSSSRSGRSRSSNTRAKSGNHPTSDSHTTSGNAPTTPSDTSATPTSPEASTKKRKPRHRGGRNRRKPGNAEE
jgi:superfamily II DNA/RNA helicase